MSDGSSVGGPYTGPWPVDEHPYLQDTAQARWQFDQDLAQLLAAAEEPDSTPPGGYAPSSGPGHRSGPAPRPGVAHRRRSNRVDLLRDLANALAFPGTARWLRRLSLLLAAATAATVTTVSTLGAAISYAPMRHLAALGVSPTLAGWWPLLVFGPWLAASLSIVRAAIHQRPAKLAWAAVLAFTTVAVYLCVVRAPHTIAAIIVSGLPPIAALASFHQLVHQITLSAPPRHAIPRPRAAHHGRR